MIFRSLIQTLIILLVGARTVQPVHDLRKKPTKEDHLRTINCTLKRYSYIFIALFLLAVLIIFFWACFSFVGASGVESGNYYNHISDVI